MSSYPGDEHFSYDTYLKHMKESRMTAKKMARGFASMPKEKQREIAAKGGRAAHEKGTAHEWTGGPNGTASAAGKKGGQATRGNHQA